MHPNGPAYHRDRSLGSSPATSRAHVFEAWSLVARNTIAHVPRQERAASGPRPGSHQAAQTWPSLTVSVLGCTRHSLKPRSAARWSIMYPAVQRGPVGFSRASSGGGPRQVRFSRMRSSSRAAGGGVILKIRSRGRCRAAKAMQAGRDGIWAIGRTASQQRPSVSRRLTPAHRLQLHRDEARTHEAGTVDDAHLAPLAPQDCLPVLGLARCPGRAHSGHAEECVQQRRLADVRLPDEPYCEGVVVGVCSFH